MVAGLYAQKKNWVEESIELAWLGLAWLVTLSIDEVELEINRVGESENTRKLKQIEKRKILQSCSQVR